MPRLRLRNRDLTCCIAFIAAILVLLPSASASAQSRSEGPALDYCAAASRGAEREERAARLLEAERRVAEAVLEVFAEASRVVVVMRARGTTAPHGLRRHFLDHWIEIKRQLCGCLAEEERQGPRCETIAEDQQMARLLLSIPGDPELSADAYLWHHREGKVRYVEDLLSCRLPRAVEMKRLRVLGYAFERPDRAAVEACMRERGWERR